jgi:hypothetical protein
VLDKSISCSPHEVIASAHDFAEQMLASQRKFAEDALKAMAPGR